MAGSMIPMGDASQGLRPAQDTAVQVPERFDTDETAEASENAPQPVTSAIPQQMASPVAHHSDHSSQTQLGAQRAQGSDTSHRAFQASTSSGDHAAVHQSSPSSTILSCHTQASRSRKLAESQSSVKDATPAPQASANLGIFVEAIEAWAGRQQGNGFWLGHAANFGPAAHAEHSCVAVCCNPLYAPSAAAASISPPGSPRPLRMQCLPDRSPGILHRPHQAALHGTDRPHLGASAAAFHAPYTRSLSRQHEHADGSARHGPGPDVSPSSPRFQRMQHPSSLQSVKSLATTQLAHESSGWEAAREQHTAQAGIHPRRLFQSANKREHEQMKTSMQPWQGLSARPLPQGIFQQAKGHGAAQGGGHGYQSSPRNLLNGVLGQQQRHAIESHGPHEDDFWPSGSRVDANEHTPSSLPRSRPHVVSAQAGLHADRCDPRTCCQQPAKFQKPKSSAAGIGRFLGSSASPGKSASQQNFWKCAQTSSPKSSRHADLHAMADEQNSVPHQPPHVCSSLAYRHAPQRRSVIAARSLCSPTRNAWIAATELRSGHDFEGMQTSIAAAGKSLSPEGRLKGAMQRMSRIHARQAQARPLTSCCESRYSCLPPHSCAVRIVQDVTSLEKGRSTL